MGARQRCIVYMESGAERQQLRSDMPTEQISLNRKLKMAMLGRSRGCGRNYQQMASLQ